MKDVFEKYLTSKNGQVFLLSEGKVYSIYVHPNSYCANCAGGYYGRYKEVRNGTFSVITETEFGKAVKKLIIEKCLKISLGKIEWIGGSGDHPVYIRMDTTIPMTGWWKIVGGGFHTTCGCGSPDKTSVAVGLSATEVLIQFAMKQTEWSSYGFQSYEIMPISAGEAQSVNPLTFEYISNNKETFI